MTETESCQHDHQPFRALFAAMVEGVALHEIIYDDRGEAVDYVILDVNPAFEQHTGLARQAVVGRRASEAYGTGYAPYLDLYARVAETGESTRFEVYFAPLQRHFQVTAFSTTKGHFVTVFEDITRRKQDEDTLRREMASATHRYHLLLALSHIAQAVQQVCTPDNVYHVLGNELGQIGYRTFVLTLDQDHTGLHIAYLDVEPALIQQVEQLANKESSKLTIPIVPGGFLERTLAVEEAIFHPCASALLAEVLPVELQAHAARLMDWIRLDLPLICAPLRTGEHTHGLFAVIGDDLTEADCPAVDVLARQAAIALEKARLQAQLARSKREWEATFDAIADSISIHDQEYRIVQANRALAERLGTTPAALVGRHCYEIFHHTTRPPSWCPCHKAHSHGQRESLEAEETALDGIFQVSVYPLPQENGSYHYVHVMQDITERKRMEAEIIQAERLAAVGQAAATIVHEVRNALSAVSSGLQYLRETFAPDDDRLEACAVLENELERTFRILEDIRLATRPLTLEPQVCSLEAIVEKVLRQIKPELTRAGLSVQRAYDQVPPLPLDSPRIEQALVNLLRNACESSPRSSQIDIAIRLIAANGQPAAVLLSITDHGSGMSPEILARAGEPFFTTKRTGLGLGLTIARRLIEAHGGSLELQSTVGVGTVATAIFPLKE